MANYLCFTAQEDISTIIMNIGKTGCTYQTSTDGTTWLDYTLGDTITLTNIGDKVYFKGTGIFNGSSTSIFEMTGKIAASGSIMSLIDSTGESTILTDNRQFLYCFKDCTELTQAPELPATTLAPYCYNCMFAECHSLTQAPELPATTLAPNCYYEMFYGCNKLNHVKVDALEWNTDYAENWLYNTASTGIVECLPELLEGDNAIPLNSASGIPVNWNVKKISFEQLLALKNLKTYHQNLYNKFGLTKSMIYKAPNAKGEANSVKSALDELYDKSELDIVTKEEIETLFN